MVICINTTQKTQIVFLSLEVFNKFGSKFANTTNIHSNAFLNGITDNINYFKICIHFPLPVWWVLQVFLFTKVAEFSIFFCYRWDAYSKVRLEDSFCHNLFEFNLLICHTDNSTFEKISQREKVDLRCFFTLGVFSASNESKFKQNSRCYVTTLHCRSYFYL